MRKRIALLAAAGLLAGGVTACGTGSDGLPGKVGVILPDTATSQRWDSYDKKYLRAAFDRAGVTADIQNAQGDKNQFLTLADGMIADGVTVLMIVNLDAGTGRAVLGRARAAGVHTIDYDRLTPDGGADYHVSFDNVAVGRLQGEGLIKCLAGAKADRPMVAALNGSPTDNNATLFAEGYNAVLDPRYADGTFVKGPDESVPAWDNAQAATIFEQMLTEHRQIRGVLAANDGLSNAVISVLRKQGLNGRIPVTGQDATVQGLRNILAGDQCMTVYKAIEDEAEVAAGLAVALARGDREPATPTVLLTPQAIYQDNVNDVVKDGFVTKEQLCTGEFARLCTDHGVS
ncbi:sugar ABC transporter substrate-binding protein [Actinoplanes sp. NPDC051494]|uniref:sugar ABC transporter substrate-binding protein n=1 Tax=Actinoplanes sp. NPDC051494 TaxID=3363907 RepID=UPI0037BA171C